MLHIGAITPETEDDSVKLMSKIYICYAVSSLVTSFVLGYFIERIGPLKLLNFQLTMVLLALFSMIFWKSFNGLMFMTTVYGLASNFDVCINSMVNFTRKESFTNLAKYSQIVKYGMFIFGSIMSSQSLNLNKKYAWENYFFTQFLVFSLAIIYFKLSFRGYKENDFQANPDSQALKTYKRHNTDDGNNPLEKKIFGLNPYLDNNTDLKYSKNEIELEKLPLTDIHSNNNSEIFIQQEPDKHSFIEDISAYFKDSASIFSKQKSIQKLFFACLLISLVEATFERIVTQWIEINRSGGGIEMSSDQVGTMKFVGFIIGLILFIFIFPSKSNPKRLKGIFTISCFSQFLFLTILPFLRYFDDQNSRMAYFFWNMANQLFSVIMFGTVFVLISSNIPQKHLGSFYASTKFFSHILSAILFYFLGGMIKIILLEDFFEETFGNSKTLVFFLPGSLMFLGVLYFTKDVNFNLMEKELPNKICQSFEPD